MILHFKKDCADCSCQNMSNKGIQKIVLYNRWKFPTKRDSMKYEMITQIVTLKFGNSTNPTDITNSDR